MSRFSRILIVLLVVLCGAIAARAAVITVNPEVQLQTMDGFGAHGAMNVWWSNGPFYNDNFLSLLLDDLGMTIFRNEYYPDESHNAMGYGSGQWQKQLPYLRAVRDAAASRGIPVKFMATLWSPPGGMKYNNVTNGTDVMWNRVSNGLGPYNNFLEPTRHPERGGKSNMYPALVTYCADAVARYKTDVNVDLYAFSPANEPRFAQPYNSCVWEPAQYRDLIALLGPEFQRRNFTTKIIGAEDMAFNGAEYAGRINAYAPAKPHLHIFAIHGYSNGVDPYLPSSAARAMAQVGTSMGIPVWMTETSGYHDTWQGAHDLAMTMAGSIKHGRVAGWVWWQISEGGMSEYVLMNNGAPGIRYYASKQFYRYIRPGAVLIQSSSDDQDILDIAFRHPQTNQFVMVLVNNGTGAKSVQLSGGDVPASLKAYRSTSSDRCTDIGTVNRSSINLPAKSIMTLVGENYNPVVGVDGRVRNAKTVAAARGLTEQRITIDGRVVRGGKSGVSGVYCSVLRDASGAAVSHSRVVLTSAVQVK